MIKENLPIICKLDYESLDTSFLETIKSFRPISLTIEEAQSIILNMPTNTNVYIVKVNESIVACGTIMIEQKFIHNGGKVAHLEDIAVQQRFRGLGYGRLIMNHLLKLAEEAGCYKAILNCNDMVEDFYTKIGFNRCASQMRINFRDKI